MIGVILLKNDENGSYRYVRITVYDSIYYENMGNGAALTSYVLDTFSMHAEKTLTDGFNSPELNILEIYRLWDEAKKYFHGHPTATQFRFKYDNGEFEFSSPISSNGAFGVPNPVQTLYRCGLYVLCEGDNNGLTPLEASVVCDLLNFAFGTLYGTGCRIYGCACTSIYADVSPFMKNAYLRHCIFGAVKNKSGLGKEIAQLYRKYLNISRTCSAGIIKKRFSDIAEPRGISGNICEEFLNDISHARIATAKRMSDAFGAVFTTQSTKQILHIPLEWAESEDFGRCVDSAKELGKRLVRYGYLENENRADALGFEDILDLTMNLSDSVKINAAAKESGRDYRLQRRLPSPTFIDCFGKVYFF